MWRATYLSAGNIATVVMAKAPAMTASVRVKRAGVVSLANWAWALVERTQNPTIAKRSRDVSRE
jgi:hypothetical protein